MKENLIKSVSDLISTIRPTLIESGIANTNIVFVKEKLEKLEDDQIKELILWLEVFEKVYCKLIPKAKALVHQGVWDIYASTGAKNTYEQNQLKIAKKVVRQHWIQRSNHLKRNTDEPSGTGKKSRTKTGRTSKQD